MSREVQERMGALETQVHALAGRVERLEAAPGQAWHEAGALTGERSGSDGEAPPTDVSWIDGEASPTGASRIDVEASLGRASRVEADASSSQAPRNDAEGPSASVEDLLGGRVLAWLGGSTVLVGVALLFALAISHGWIDELGRTVIAAGGSLALVVVGFVLHERRGRTDAARAAVATGVASGFATVTVAAQVYGLLPTPAALLLAALVGATGAALALRWDARGLAALGILGAVVAPVLVGAPSNLGTLALLFAAMASGVGVLLERRWSWLACAALVVGAAQWVPGVVASSNAGAALIVLIAFGALGATAAVAFELRRPHVSLHLPASVLLAFHALVVTGAGWAAFDSLDQRGLADLWPAAVAAAHLTLGFVGLRSGRVSRELALLALAVGVLLADLAFSLLASGPVLALGWAASAAVFAGLLQRSRDRHRDQALAQAGLGGHVALSLGHVLLGDAPPTALLGDQVALAPALLALAGLAAGCFASARFTDEGHSSWRMLLDGLGLAVVAYSAALAFDGPALVAVWTLEGVVLARLARGGDRVAAFGGLAHLAGAALHALTFEAPPTALVVGLPDVLAGALALGALAAGSLAAARIGPDRAHWREGFLGLECGALLLLASTALVSAFQPGESVTTVLDLGVRQQGQALLSGLWASVGVAALVVGLRRDVRTVRLAGLALLLVTVAKVFLYDLATLTSLYRVGSVVALGLLLLVGAFAWQRARPRAPEDLRRVPAALR